MTPDSNVVLAADAFTNLLFIVIGVASIAVLIPCAVVLIRYFIKVR